MRQRLTLFLLLVLMTPVGTIDAQDLRTLDKNECIRNLRLIHDAIQAYKSDHHDLPEWLSDLSPQYIADPAILNCPEARRRGVTSIATTGRKQLRDPKTSYFYEFNNVVLDRTSQNTNPQARITNRQWKEAQMKVVGAAVPIVRCLGAHDRSLNLSFGGEIYESPFDWELNFTNRVSHEKLMDIPEAPPALFSTTHVSPRPSAAGPYQIDLSSYYNASLTKPWIRGESEKSLATLPLGVQKFRGITFDVRGLIQLSSRTLQAAAPEFPVAVTNIIIGRPCRRVHLLVGCTQPATDGTEVANVTFHLADSKVRQKTIVVGQHLWPGWSSGNDTPLPDGEAAWKNKGAAGGTLYLTTWENPPRTPVTSIELRSLMTSVDLFVAAVTVEP